MADGAPQAGRAAGTPIPAAVPRRLLASPLFWRLVSVALVCGAWEVAGRIPVNYAFPTFSATFLAFLRLLLDGSLPLAYADTLVPLVIGVLLSAVAGVGLGVAMGLRPWMEWLWGPLFVVMQAAPMAALIPLVTFVYGIGLTAKVASVCLLALPVIVLNSFRAIRNVDRSLVEMARVFLASPRQQITLVILPAASPMIFAGLRLGVSAGFIGIVLAELLITPTGIGDLVTYHRAVGEYAEMYATIASIIVFSAVVLSGLERVETALFRPERRRRR